MDCVYCYEQRLCKGWAGASTLSDDIKHIGIDTLGQLNLSLQIYCLFSALSKECLELNSLHFMVLKQINTELRHNPMCFKGLFYITINEIVLIAQFGISQ